MEFVRRTIRQTGVESDIVFAVGETPVGDAQLQLLGHWRIDLLDQFEGDVRGDTTRCQLGQCADCVGFCIIQILESKLFFFGLCFFF